MQKNKTGPSVLTLVVENSPNTGPRYFICASCETGHSPKHYGSGPAGIIAAHAAADRCQRCSPTCQSCNATMPPGTHGPCKACIERSRDDYTNRSLEKATLDATIEECFSASGDTFYNDLEEARDAGATDVFAAKFEPYSVDMNNFFDNVVADHHEDASIDDLVDTDALVDAIKAFNKAQVGGSYYPDKTKRAEINHPYTLAIIKPDATGRGDAPAILAMIEQAGFTVIARQDRALTRDEALELYREHNARPHYRELVEWTIAGEAVILQLTSPHRNTPAAFRGLMGAYSATRTDDNTIRGQFGTGIRENAIHGSDGPVAAMHELALFFPNATWPPIGDHPATVSPGRRTLKALKRDGAAAATRRGHDLGQWRRQWPASGEIIYRATCRNTGCNGYVDASQTLLPNGIDLGGSALAVSCPTTT